MITSIVIPTDFSPAAWKATQVGLDFIRSNGDVRLSLVHVYPIQKQLAKEMNGELTKRLKTVENKMREFSRDLAPSDKNIESVVLSGDIQERVLNFIQENTFDLVILGVNSNGLDNEIGSHTLQVIEKSGTPVLIVPNQA